MSLYKALLSNTNNSTVVNKSSSISEDSSVFEYNLSLMGEVNNIIAQKHFEAFQEGIGSDIIAPALSPLIKSRFNFVRLMNDMISLNVSVINQTYNKTETIMKQITKEDARIKPYVSDIMNFNKSFKISEGWYNFTNLDIDIPPYDLHRRVEEEFNKIYGKVNSIVSQSDSNIEIEDSIISLYMELSGDTFYRQGDIYDTKNQYKLDEKLLKGVLDDVSVNANLIYTETDSYAEQVYAYFRDGNRDPKMDTITPDIVRKSFDRYNHSKITMRNLKTAKDNLIKSYMEIRRSAERSYDMIYTKLVSEKAKDYMDKIMRFEIVKMMYYCNGYNLLFSGRLDANVHAMLQDKKITLYAVQIILNDKEAV